MPKKPSDAQRRAQAKNSKQFEKELAAAERQRIREYNAHKAWRARERERAAREADKHLLQILKQAHGKGIYEPKELTLTKYRRSRARQVEQQYGEFIKGEFFYFEAPKSKKKEVITRAENLKMKTTHKGFFVAKNKHKRAKLVYDKRHDEFHVVMSGKTKHGPNRGRKYKTITPLANLDELSVERERLRRMARKLMPLKSEERLAFVVVENGVEGASHRTFGGTGERPIEALIAYLDNYKKDVAARIQFYRHIRIEKTSPTNWLNKHPPRSPGDKRKLDTRRSKG